MAIMALKRSPVFKVHQYWNMLPGNQIQIGPGKCQDKRAKMALVRSPERSRFI
ncbi:hypothetical protein DPMN_010385 [Dreissena polymorpha]|uniref:Uncharacterized protein n=1 Tax=Dreissena polymorpha TaxID=45954 RepID=A0A9D4S0X3_DREPO|nr:hypothetical protein DPMN_010385 [Dreissena polymorpha]